MTKYGVREKRFLLTQFHARKASVALWHGLLHLWGSGIGEIWLHTTSKTLEQSEEVVDTPEEVDSPWLPRLCTWLCTWHCALLPRCDLQPRISSSSFNVPGIDGPAPDVHCAERGAERGITDMVSVIHGRVVLHLSLFSDAVTEYQRQGYL